MSKLRFIETLINLDNNMPKGLSECEKYGMISGCDEYCPVFMERKCELQQELERKFMEKEKC